MFAVAAFGGTLPKMFGGRTTFDGATARPPGREQTNMLAVVDNVSVSAQGFLPLACADGGGFPHVSEAAPNSIPLADDATVLPRRRRITGDTFIPAEVTTAVRGLRPAGGGIFFSDTIRHEFGDQAVRDVSESFHANQHGGDNVPNQGNAFPVSRNEGPRS